MLALSPSASGFRLSYKRFSGNNDAIEISYVTNSKGKDVTFNIYLKPLGAKHKGYEKTGSAPSLFLNLKGQMLRKF